MRSLLTSLLALAALAALPALAQREGLPDDLLGECPGADKLPIGRYIAVDAWEAEGARTGHTTGVSVADPGASAGQAWQVRPGEDQSGAAIYGPYVTDLPEADYVVFLRMKTTGPITEEAYGLLDACVGNGQDILGAWELMGSDLRPDSYVEVPLGFHYAGGRLECRLTWYGYAPVTIDSLRLFRLEGGTVASGHWRVPEAVPSGEPKDLAQPRAERPFPGIFPRSKPPAKHLYVLDTRPLMPDQRLAAYVLEGLVNREVPRLYCVTQPYDELWLKHMRERGWVESTETVAGFDDLLARFGSVLKGMVITDPALPASKNVATMIASVEDALVASPRLAEPLKLPVVEDLRGRWTTSVDATRWAFDHLWPRLNHFVIACSYPDHYALRDYLVENRVFIFWLSGALDGARPYANPDAEVRLMEELLAKMPVNMPVMSYPWAAKDIGIGEGPGVTLFAEFGKYLVGSIDAPNLSVHSGIRVESLKQKPAPPAPVLDPTKTYFSFIMSDGDNLPVLTTSNFPALWEDPTRGQVPVGWTLSPSASMLVPDLVDYYYSTSGPSDCWLGAVSGIGYTYPDSYAKRYRDPDRGRIFDGFLAQTAEYMAKSDLHAAWIMNATRPEVIARFAERIPGLEAIFPDYGRRLIRAEDLTYPTAANVPVFHAATTWNQQDTREERIARMVTDIQEMTVARKPAFLHAFVLNWFADLPMLEEVARRLGPDYVCVRPDHLVELYRTDLAERKLLVRLPSTAAALEGVPLRLEGRLQNVTAGAGEVRIAVTSGLDGAVVEPATLRAEPATPVAFTATGTPTADSVVIGTSGALGRSESTVALRMIGTTEIVGDLPELQSLTPAAYLEAEALAHREGALSQDAEASGGAGWLSEVGNAKPSYMVFGPYAPLEEGRYLVLFRVKRTSEGTGLLATLDAGPAGGASPMAVTTIDCDALPLGEWRYVPVVMEHTGGAYETRVRWEGPAGLSVDCIVVWRVGE
jgi:hypothetical protein